MNDRQIISNCIDIFIEHVSQFIFSCRLVNLGLDPVNVGRDLCINSREGRHGAGLDRPRHNASLVTIHKERAARVTLKNVDSLNQLGK